jgi:omega-6 fatty acid desaturase (delta-12 desaturase)
MPHVSRTGWKQDLAVYLEVDRARSIGQIASVVVPYLAVWSLAAAIRPNAWQAVALGLAATVFLMRMYSLFHDLTHNSLFESRAANRRWGHLLGFLLFTPYRWWQRQHSLHHAHTGNLDKRGPGEINTMTVAEYESASRLRRLGYRLYRNPLLMLLVGPSLVFLFERRFPQRGMSRRILVSVVLTNVALAAWAIGWSALAGWGTYLLVQATTLVAGGVVGAWMLYIQHQYEDTYYQSAGEWQFELAALQGSSHLKLPRVLAWMVGNANYHHVHHLSAKIPNYRLRAAHEEQPMFARTPVVTVRTGIGALRLKLWDEQAGSLVRFPSRAEAKAPSRQGAFVVRVDVDAVRQPVASLDRSPTMRAAISAAGKKNTLKTKYPRKLWPLRAAIRAGQKAIDTHTIARSTARTRDIPRPPNRGRCDGGHPYPPLL